MMAKFNANQKEGCVMMNYYHHRTRGPVFALHHPVLQG